MTQRAAAAAAAPAYLGDRPDLQQRHSSHTLINRTARRFRQRTEFSRHKDALRHLQPWADTYKPPSLYQNAFQDVKEQLPIPGACPDTALAAFAQLCALRLNVDRCLISLITGDTEYVLADITQSMPLQPGTLRDHGKAGLWIGTCSFAKSQGICGGSVDNWRTARSPREPPAEKDYFYTQGMSPHWRIVSDARHDAELKKMFAGRGQWIRFCAAVPLRGAYGSVIGAITVLDAIPRYGIGTSDMTFLEDISDTIVEHLHATVVRAQRERGERLIQALGLFNGGKDTLRDWWLGQDDARALNTGRRVNVATALERQQRVDAEFGSQLSATFDKTTMGASTTTTRTDAREGHSGLCPTTPIFFKPGSPGDGDLTASPPSPLTEPLLPSTQVRDAPPHTSRASHSTFTSSHSTESLSRLYARASNLLREALGADGVVFANAGAIPARLQRTDSGDSSATSVASSSYRPSSDSESVLSSGLDDANNSNTRIDANDNARLSEVYSFSTRTKTSLAGFQPEDIAFQMPEWQMRKIIKRYPHGTVFHFDESGLSHTSSSEGSAQSSSDDTTRDRKSRKKDGQALRRAMKGARTIAVYPLWDEAHGSWRSCLFAWVTSARYFDQQEDLTYLTAFGHSILAEISRIESVLADAAKGSFISSISHELRSPLHGIMAGTDFLQETRLTRYQQEMTNTISMAGRMLLDTINHILDYSKISSYSRARANRPKMGMRGVTERTTSQQARFNDEPTVVHRADLAQLTEEVVETVVNAHRSQYQTSKSPQTLRKQGKSVRLAAGSTNAGNVFHPTRREEVSVILNIEPRKNWLVDIQSGGWTRILTNLLGNALKYTNQGHITVDLKAGKAVVNERNVEVCPVELSFEDTGMGISDTFQNHGLFTPFKQEDPHSTGTGLGLSIVKQIVRDMDAEIRVESQQGKGTVVTVQCLATFIHEPQDAVSAIDEKEKSPELLIDVDSFHMLSCPLDQGTVCEDDPGALVSGSVLKLASEWLRSDTSEGPDVAETDGNSVCAVTEELVSRLETDNPERLSRLLAAASLHHSYLLVLACSLDAVTLNGWPGHQSSITPIFLHQPIGPRKLARAIASWKDAVSAPYPSRPTSTHSSQSDLSAPEALTPDDWRKSSQARAQPTSTTVTSSTEQVEELPGHERHPSHMDRPDDTVDTTTHSEDRDSPTQVSQSMNSGERSKVLLVEDNSVNMKLLIALMRKLKLDFECALHGREALDIYRKDAASFFIIFMDISMPVMDGYTATVKIRQHEQATRLSRTVVVALTGVTSAEAKAKAFDCGVDEFFAKPVRMNELKDLLDRARE